MVRCEMSLSRDEVLHETDMNLQLDVRFTVVLIVGFG